MLTVKQIVAAEPIEKPYRLVDDNRWSDPVPISSITLKCSKTLPGATVTSVAPFLRPSKMPNRVDRTGTVYRIGDTPYLK